MRKLLKQAALFVALLTILLIVVSLFWVPGKAPVRKKRLVAVALVNPNGATDEVNRGFKDALREQGFEEDENIRYISVDTHQVTENTLQQLATRVDLFFSVSSPVTRMVKNAAGDNGTPTVFMMYDPVTSGIIDSLARPGCHLTGVQIRGNTGKALGWLLSLSPDIHHVIAPLKYDTAAARQSGEDLLDGAKKLGIDVDLVEVNTEADLDRVLAARGNRADAVFALHSLFIYKHINKLLEFAKTHTIPLGSCCALYDDGVMISYGANRYFAGRQVGRMACRILNGDSPESIPTEISDYFLGINLKTAVEARVDIPDDILLQADYIAR